MRLSTEKLELVHPATTRSPVNSSWVAGLNGTVDPPPISQTLYKEECDEIGGTNDHEDPIHGRI